MENRKIVVIFPNLKRIQLIEWGIITIGLIFGYKFFEGIFTSLVQLLYSFQFGGGDLTGLLFSNLLIIAIYAVCFIFLIRRSRQIALYISGTSAGENVPVRIGKQSLLQVILIGICAATIIHKITEILIYLFEIFKEEAGRNTYNENSGSKVSKYTFKIAAIQTIVALVVLYFSKDISGWFVRKNEADELTFDSNSEN